MNAHVKRVRTRKPHDCWGCASRFPAGSELDAVTSADGGKIFTTYWCDVCQHVWSEDYHTGDNVGLGEVKANDPEAWAASEATLAMAVCRIGEAK